MDAVARAHARLLHDHSLQFGFAAFKPPEPPWWLKPLGRLIKAIAPLLGWIFWIALALALVGVLAFILREVVGVGVDRRRRAEAAPAADWRPEPARARALLEQADALAASGRFAEAARLLLHRSLEDIAERRPQLLRPAYTAREIAGMDALPAAARGAFGHIAGVVELSFFGGRPVREDEFLGCREAYRAFAFAEDWR